MAGLHTQPIKKFLKALIHCASLGFQQKPTFVTETWKSVVGCVRNLAPKSHNVTCAVVTHIYKPYKSRMLQLMRHFKLHFYKYFFFFQTLCEQYRWMTRDDGPVSIFFPICIQIKAANCRLQIVGFIWPKTVRKAKQLHNWEAGIRCFFAIFA